MPKKRILLALFVATTLGACHARAAVSPSETMLPPGLPETAVSIRPIAVVSSRAAVEALLAEHHGAPSSEALRSFGATADLLCDIVDDEAALPLVRNRALQSLADFGGKRSARVLEHWAARGATAYVRKVAAESHARMTTAARPL